jgi:hypothetical protein
VTARIEVGRATSLTFGADSLWVAVDSATPLERAIIRIDPNTNDIVATIPTTVVPEWEVGGGGLAFGQGSLWVGGHDEDSGVLIRIDAATNEIVDTMRLPDSPISDVAVGDPTIWVLSRDASANPKVMRVDPMTGLVVSSIDLAGGYGRFLLVEDNIAVASLAQPPGGPYDNGTLVFIDGSTDRVSGTFVLGTYPSVAFGEGSLWAETDQGLRRFDTRTGEPSSAPIESPCSGDALAAGTGGVWCFDPARGRELIHVNGQTSQVDISVPLGEEVQPTDLTIAPGSIWVASDSQIIRVDLT